MARRRKRRGNRRGNQGFRPPQLVSGGVGSPFTSGLSAAQEAEIEQFRSEGRKLPRRLRRARRRARRGSDLGTAGGALNAAFQGAATQGQLADFFNRIGQQTDFGSRRFVTDPETGRQMVIDQLSPEGQGLLDQLRGAQSGLAGQLGQATGSPLDFGGLQQIPGLQDFAADRRRIEDQLFARFNEQFEPVFQQQRDQLQQDLAQRGIPLGSELFDEELRKLDERQNEARSSARAQASTFAGAEQERLFNTALSGRQQGIAEQVQQRAQPFQELGSLLSLQGGIPQTNFGPISQIGIPNVDVLGGALGFGNLDLGRQDLALRRELGVGQLGQFVNPLDQIRARGEEERRTIAFRDQFAQPQQQAPSLSPSDQFAGAIGGGIGAGIGSAIGGLF